MYSLKSDWAQKKKKQALRRLSQSGQKGASPSASGRTYAAGGGIARGRRGGGRPGVRGRGRGASAMGMRTTIARHLQQAQKQQQDNPFLVASTSTQNNSQNPFLGGGKIAVTTSVSSSTQSVSHNTSQIAQQQQSSFNPFLTSRPIASVPSSSSQPPSYASIVSGGGAATQARIVRQPPQGSVPTFITHGPNSVQMMPERHSDITPASTQTTNQFISAPSLLQSSQPPISTSTLLGPTKFQIPINVPQFALNTQGSTSQAPPPPPQLPSYSQTMLSSTYQPALQMSAATIAPPQSGAGALPLNMTLHVKGVPDELNNQAFMEKHFSRFGPLKAVECHPQKKYATVTFRDKESAVKAKRGGKILSPKYRPVQMFWQAMSVDKPAQTKQINQANSMPATNTADVQQQQQQQLSEQWKDEGDADSGLEDGAQADSLRQEEETGVRPSSTILKKPILKSVRYVAKRSSAKSKLVTRAPAEKSLTGTSGGVQKKSIWERLGNRVGESSGKQATVDRKGKSKANDDDQEWQPEGEDGRERAGSQDEGEGEGEEEIRNAPILPRELADLGLTTTGDEMDTIARYVEHPYFLRSLTQSGAYPGPKADYQREEQQQQPQQKLKITVQKSSRIPQGVDSRQAYVIPNPQLPPPPRPKGTSANDLYESLDARDQDIRKAMVKHTSLTSAKSVVGTCPDMCPEKERYRREDTRRLSWFEVDHSTYEPGNAKVDHSKAIKEYSGSAADKEEPLPHELRPISVLQMTMDYLVTMVMDEGGDRLGDWYDFVWNRTRAIRKDITLQHLSTYECVELTEKCARFHILCSYLLCEEDMSDFDPKLNSENLNKCLLSLKEFYRDLRHQKGLVCPNEAEFCGYDILLHLTDGDVLNIVGKYSPGVQEKPPVRFAVEAALALDSNNFVKFFKMVKNTTFLNACIMHGYFTMVRTRALRTMNRAHSVARKSIPFPLSTVATMLAFPNPRKAGDFCAEFQLVVSDESVEFVRLSLPNPAEAIPRKRSPHLVDVKNTKSLGECVNGGPLPLPPIHTPYSSFSPGAQLLSREPSPLPAPPAAPPPQPTYSIIDMATTVNDVVDEVVINDLKDLVQESFHQLEAIEIKEQALVSVCSSLFDSTVLEESKQVARETLLEEVDVHRVKEELSLRLLERVLLEVISSETHLVIHDTYRDCVVEAEAKAAATLSVTSSLVEEGVSECVKVLVEEALNEAWKERMEHLEALRVSLERKRLLKYWKRWCRMLSIRQHVHKCVAAIPPLPPVVTLPWQLEALLPNEKRRRVESMSLAENTVAQLLEESREEREKKRKEFLSPLNLQSLLQESLLLSRILDTLTSSSQPCSTQHIFWKMAFVFHSQRNLTPSDSRIVEWLYHKLQFQPRGRNDDSISASLSPSEVELQTLSLTSSPLLSKAGAGRVSSLPVVEGEDSGRSRQLCLAVKGCCDEILWRKDDAIIRQLRGTSAMAVFLPTPQQFSDQTAESLIAYVLQVVERVVSKESFPRVPLLILCSNEMEEKFLAMWIQIRMALSEVHHSSFSVINYLLVDLSSTESSCQSEKQLAQALCRLAKSSPPQPDLFHQPLREFVEQGLLKHFASPVVSDGDARRKACLPSQLPSPIISLYNTVVQHLIETATSDEVRALNWPVTEFVSSKNFSHGGLPPVHWNSSDYLARLQDSLSSLLLPPPPTLPQHADWSLQCAQCMDYVRSISLPTDDVMAIIPLTSRVKALLHHAEDHSELFIPWDHVILVCAEHMVAYLTSDLWVSSFHGKNTTVTFPLPSEWLKAQAETTLAQVTSNSTPGSIRKRRRHHSDPPCAEVTSTPAYSHSPQASLSVGVSPASTLAATHSSFSYRAEDEELRRKLESSLEKEKALSQSFEAQLQQWLSPTSYTATSSSKRQPTRGRGSVELERSQVGEDKLEHYDSSEDSIRKGLQQLRKKIRLAKYLDTKDNILLHSLMNSPHLTSPQS